MTDSWAMPPSQTGRLGRTVQDRLRGTVDGRMRGTAPVHKPLDLENDMTPGEILAGIITVFQDYTNIVGYTELINNFLTSFGDVLTSQTFNTSVTNFIESVIQEITQYLDEHTNEYTQNFTEEVLQEITYYLNHNDNSVTENFAGAVLQEITNYIEKNGGDTLVKQFLDALAGAGGMGVYVQPEEPVTDRIGALWFDTDAF